MTRLRLALLLLALLSFGSLSYGLSAPGAGLLPIANPISAPKASLEQAGIRYQLRLDRAIYQPGQPLQIEFSVSNQKNISRNFSSSRQPAGPGFAILREKKLWWSWPGVAHRVGRSQQEWFGPGLTIIYRLNWNQIAAGKTLPAGRYTLLATFPPLEDSGRSALTELSLEFNIVDKLSPQPQNPAGLQAALLTDKTKYAAGEPVNLQLSIKNIGPTPLTFNSSNSQRFEFIVHIGGKEIWRWSRGRMFAMMLSSWKLAPGAAVTYNAVWEQKDHDGKPVPSGAYIITGQQIGGGQATAEISIK